jgi:hypothetical protein
MALLQEEKTVSLNTVRTGQVLKITYDGDEDLILVVDPNAKTVIDTSQGRKNKLHAIKLQQLVETDLAELISMVRSIRNVNPRLIYDMFKSSPYADGKRNYRTYTREKIGKAIKRVTVGQASDGTNKIQIGKSILYGAIHGSHIELSVNDYDTFAEELKSRNYFTFFEGPSHEPITKELFSLCLPRTEVSQIISKAKSWEPPENKFTDNSAIGRLVAGWWNQTFDDAVGLENLKNEWMKTGVSLDKTIKEAFSKSVGNLYQTILDNFTGYEAYGRYSKQAFLNTLGERAFDDAGNFTDALYDFNQAGHDQVFPEDNNLPYGKLKESEQSFNKERDLHLIEEMKTTAGVYFAGSGHLDNLRKMGY